MSRGAILLDGDVLELRARAQSLSDHTGANGSVECKQLVVIDDEAGADAISQEELAIVLSEDAEEAVLAEDVDLARLSRGDLTRDLRELNPCDHDLAWPVFEATFEMDETVIGQAIQDATVLARAVAAERTES